MVQNEVLIRKISSKYAVASCAVKVSKVTTCNNYESLLIFMANVECEPKSLTLHHEVRNDAMENGASISIAFLQNLAIMCMSYQLSTSYSNDVTSWLARETKFLTVFGEVAPNNPMMILSVGAPSTARSRYTFSVTRASSTRDQAACDAQTTKKYVHSMFNFMICIHTYSSIPNAIVSTQK